MIAVIVIAVLAGLALAYVALPIARSSRRELAEPSTLAEDAAARKRNALAAIVDLENDREIGKLSARDFEILRAEYEAEALMALRELDAIAGAPGNADPLEAEIAALREEMECPRCGATRPAGALCPRCGA